MPRLSAFYGIVIYLYWDDHNPPHYHARYGEHEAWIAITTAAVLHGSLPRRALRLVRTWHHLHQAELEAAWEKAKANQTPGTIEPLIMKINYRIPHVEAVEVPRPHVMRLAFDDGLIREFEFVTGGNEGTVFAAFEDADFFAQVAVDPQSRTVVWPNGVDLDPAVLHGDFDPANKPHFREITHGRHQRGARSG